MDFVLMVHILIHLMPCWSTAPGVTTEQQLVSAMVLYLMSLPVSVLMVHNHNRSHSSSRSWNVTTPELQLVCADGTAPNVTTGLCADGSQPQSQSFNATCPGVTTPEQQLVCADGTAPDVTTGLCADGSQPQSQSFNATDSWCYHT